MAFTGDILPHSPLWRRAADNARVAGGTGFDFDPMLVGLAPLIAPVDLAVCHLETPIAPVGESLSTMPLYGVPAEIVDAIADAGYDRCSTASNHAADRGAAGIDRTVSVLEATGSASRAWRARPTRSRRTCSTSTASPSRTCRTRSATTVCRCRRARSGGRR